MAWLLPGNAPADPPAVYASLAVTHKFKGPACCADTVPILKLDKVEQPQRTGTLVVPRCCLLSAILANTASDWLNMFSRADVAAVQQRRDETSSQTAVRMLVLP